ncbi:helix-turn-helix transcriptional regulator [Amnibacterium endophyticum]|uniref:Helix-turn-helix transcriptional regulator n=1 Tax=Amnibacterium endophyticum TaxID=2109337 RepID=A0ABW4LAS3_9MICO
MTGDLASFGAFVLQRRQALQPEDVGLPRGARRRTAGLRREEVALLAHMSPDYYARLERGTGPQPSEQMIAAIAQGLHLSVDERDHLFRLAGHRPPARGGEGDFVAPGMLRILDRLADTPAEVVTELGETLRQTPFAAALVGPTADLRGPARSLGFRWFTDPAARDRYAREDHAFLSRLWASGLRRVIGLRGPRSRAAGLADALLDRSEEFRQVWALGEVGLRPPERKRFVHPEVGALELTCQTLVDPETAQHLLVYTAVPGSESADRLRLLGVLGAQPVP